MANYTSFTEALEKLINSPEGTIMECEDKSHLELTVKGGTLYSFDLEDMGIESKANPILTISRMNKKWRIKPVEFDFYKAIKYLKEGHDLVAIHKVHPQLKYPLDSRSYAKGRLERAKGVGISLVELVEDCKYILAEDN